ncbi:MAG: alkaline phosphatase family protein, partial [Armatimonadetes bacterium]|nr:alkaline phosphatase family protein [Armatimonadota bacterium]
MSTSNGRLFILGVDSADYHLLSALLVAGELPAFAQVAREGFFARLPSMVPPVSAMVWPSLCTGCGPARHGIWTFFNREPSSLRWRPAQATDWGVPSLWQLVNTHGLAAAVLHVPVTYPPVPLNGVLISDSLMSPDDAVVSYPPDLFPRLKARYPDYSLTFWRPHQEDYLGDLRRFFAARKAASLEVARTSNCDLHFYVLNCVDWTAHRHPLRPSDVAAAITSGHPLVQAYRMADEFLAALLELMDERDSLLLVSDHGSEPAEAIFMVNEWLAQQGPLRYRPDWR